MPWLVTAFCTYEHSCLSYPWLWFIRIDCAPGINICLPLFCSLYLPGGGFAATTRVCNQGTRSIDWHLLRRKKSSGPRRGEPEEEAEGECEQTVTAVSFVARRSTAWPFSLLLLQTFRSTSSLAGRICHHTGLAGATERRQERPQSLSNKLAASPPFY